MNLTGQLVDGLQRNPLERCVWADDRWISSAELDEASNKLAHYLIRCGAKPNTLVGICTERSIDMMIGLLAILKSGAAYVPIDPDYPAERRQFLIADSECPILLTRSDLADSATRDGTRYFCLDTDWHLVESESEQAPTIALQDTDLAYVIYTSGSTGQPKGAMNNHEAVCNSLLWMQQKFQLGDGDVVIQKTPFSFDVSAWEFFWPIMTGTPLVFAKPRGHLDPGYLANLIEQHQVTTVTFVPSMLQAFLEQPDLRRRCRSLRTIICIGEALSVDLQDRCLERIDAQLYNLYGPAEAAIQVTYWHCNARREESVVPIGWPVSNTQIHILDDRLNRVADGQHGELHIGGIQVGMGYWRRPELTAERFIEDPFSTRAGARLYKTGDLARRRQDGAIEFLGRMDFQVKIRGQRIELGEIEAALESINEIQQAAVLARQFEADDTHLVAYYCGPGSADLDDTALRQSLARTLPEYMLPQYFVNLKNMPISPNGKLDRKLLPDPRLPAGTDAGISIDDPVEAYVAEIWRQELRLPSLGIEQRFFEVGGTSLGAARIVARLQKELGEFIYVVSMFDAPTVREYAGFLRNEYPDALARVLKINVARQRPQDAIGRLSDEDFDTFENAVPKLCASNSATGEKNPPAIFVLAPPRSGTTLLRVMLAGHKDIFAASELQLLGFETMRSRREAYAGKYSLWLEGLLRCVMEVRSCSLDEATEIVAAMERDSLTTKDCYKWLQDQIGPRLLVDKSPSYATDRAALEKAEQDFQDPLYIHLVRHPYGMARSFVNYRIEQVLYLPDSPYAGQQLAELVWTTSHRTILSFLEEIPQERQFRLKFEDLVKSPETEMRTMCNRFGIAFDSGLTTPYVNLESKMVDGVHAESTPMGDTRLLERRTIDPAVATAWKCEHEHDFLASPSVTIAKALGYEDVESLDSREKQQFKRSAATRRAKRKAIRTRHNQNA